MTESEIIALVEGMRDIRPIIARAEDLSSRQTSERSYLHAVHIHWSTRVRTPLF